MALTVFTTDERDRLLDLLGWPVSKLDYLENVMVCLEQTDTQKSTTFVSKVQALIAPYETIATQLNQARTVGIYGAITVRTPDGRSMRFDNRGEAVIGLAETLNQYRNKIRKYLDIEHDYTGFGTPLIRG